MDIKELETFCHVAEAQAVSRAAIKTDTVPSLVSRRISNLEREWGARLFNRTGRGMGLSAFGRRMYPEVKEFLQQYEALAIAAIENSGLLTGTVRIGVPPSMSQYLLPELFCDVRSRAPSVRLHVTEGFSGALIQQLDHLDMAIVSRFDESAWQSDEIMGWLDICLIGHPLPRLDERIIAFKDLEGIPLVLPPMPNRFRSALHLLSRQHGVALNIALEVETLLSMKDVVLSGHVWTLLPRIAVRDEILSGALLAWDIDKPSIRRTITLEFGKNCQPSNASRLVATRIKALAPAYLNPLPPRSPLV